MKSNSATQLRRPSNAERPFPWRCRHCGQEKVDLATIPYETEVRHDGRLHQFTIPNLQLPVCQACGEKVFTEKVDDQINAGLRSHLHYLTPAAIRQALDRIGMTEQEVAQRLGLAEGALAPWLTETHVQTRALDNLLRVFFAFPEVRAALTGAGPDPQLGTADSARLRQDGAALRS